MVLFYPFLCYPCLNRKWKDRLPINDRFYASFSLYCAFQLLCSFSITCLFQGVLNLKLQSSITSRGQKQPAEAILWSVKSIFTAKGKHYLAVRSFCDVRSGKAESNDRKERKQLCLPQDFYKLMHLGLMFWCTPQNSHVPIFPLCICSLSNLTQLMPDYQSFGFKICFLLKSSLIFNGACKRVFCFTFLQRLG